MATMAGLYKHPARIADHASTTAASTGVLVSREQRRHPVAARVQLRLPGGGVPVDYRRFEAFSDQVRKVADQIAANPNDAHRLVLDFAQHGVDEHGSALRQMQQQHALALSERDRAHATERQQLIEHYKMPHAHQWEQHRQLLHRMVASDPDIGGNRIPRLWRARVVLLTSTARRWARTRRTSF